MNFIEWCRYHQSEITWWLIGWLSMAVIDDIVRENYIWAIVDAGLIYLNYKLYKERY